MFSWNLYCNSGGHIFSQLTVNSNAFGAVLSDAEGATEIRSTTGIVVIHINSGDAVYVRTHPTRGHSGNIRSDPDWRSYFNGWKLY